jgi:hypothetical protein
MRASEFELRVTWGHDHEGAFCECTAVTTPGGMVVARVSQVAATASKSFFDRFGAAGKQQIEETCRDSCERIALAL